MARLEGSGSEQDFGNELERVRDVYAKRAEDGRYARLYAPFATAPLFTVQEREWMTARLLREAGFDSLADRDILDVGCGSGVELLRFVLHGAAPERLAGIDLMPDRVAVARRLLPAADIREGSAHSLPFADSSFDIVSQFTVFSSILDPGLRQAIAGEMRRVVRPGGFVLWYDVRRLPHRNPSLVALDREDLRALFPDGDLRALPVTLRWGVVHRIVPRSRLVGLVVQRLPAMSSHYAALVRIPGGPAPAP